MITLTIKKADGSTYWVSYFNDQVSCDKWTAEEKTRPYWNASFTYSSVDDAPDPSIAAAAKAARDAAIIATNTRYAQLQNAIANWATLTPAQKDTVLKVVITHLIG